MPNLRDVEGATQALVRIQFAYRSEISKYTNMRYADILVFRLDPLHMAQGHIHGVDTQARLTSRQMMNIAQSRYNIFFSLCTFYEPSEFSLL